MTLPRLPSIDEWVIDDTVKGFPGGRPPIALGEIRQQGWNLLNGDLPLPVAVLKASALAHNRSWMKRFLASTGAALCPHGKTTMSPQLFRAQLDDGAWGITCATISQLQVLRRFGVRRVMIANQVVGKANIAFLVDEMVRDEDFEPYVFVDSAAGVRLLAAAAAERRIKRRLRVLLEIGQPGLRTGTRSLGDANKVLEVIDSSSSWLELHGVACYEGTIPATAPDALGRIHEILSLQLEVARVAAASPAAASGEPFLLTAGGSEYFDIVIERLGHADIGRPTLPLLRSGCYLTHDHLHYGRAFMRMAQRGLPDLGQGLRPALEVWGCVQSRPEALRAYVTGGKRDLSFDLELPTPTQWYRPGLHTGPQALPVGHRAIAINDQHTHLEVPADSPLDVGDLIAFGISHPCTTFDKWRLIYLVDDDHGITDAIRTFF